MGGEEVRPGLGQIPAVEDGESLVSLDALTEGTRDADDDAGDARGHMGGAVEI